MNDSQGVYRAALADQIAKDLRTLRTAWPHMLPIGAKPGGNDVRGGGTKDAPPPAPIGVLSLRRETCEQLAAWCLLVITDRDLGHANVHSTDLMGMAGFLLIHADWLSGHEAAKDAADEIHGFANRCDAVVKELRVRRFRVGSCTEHGTSEGGERVPCAGVLFARLKSDDDVLPARLTCSVDASHTWAANEWMMLGRRLEAEGVA
jgi:hypothetical protein